mgnify:CR=1 FL=1
MGKSEYVQFDLLKLTESSNTMIIPNGYFNGNSVTSFNISNNEVLKSIVIGEECFLTTRTFELDGLNALERVVIGRWSFADVNSFDDVKNSQRTDGNYTISNCAHLKSIQIDDVSFGDYRFFTLMNLPSLESIVMGAYSFYHAPLVLQGGKWDWD